METVRGDNRYHIVSTIRVSTLPIRNGNLYTSFLHLTIFLYVSTLPIRNGNRIFSYMSLLGISTRKYLTYKEWKHSSVNSVSHHILTVSSGKYLTYKEWKLAGICRTITMPQANVPVSTLPIRNGNCALQPFRNSGDYCKYLTYKEWKHHVNEK